MPDAHKNFAYSLIATAPIPSTSGTSLAVTTGQGGLFPAVPFNATIWPASAQPTSANAEIVRVTAISTDTFTIVRQQEGTIPRSITVGDQIAATITAKTMFDAENPIVTWSPFIMWSLQTGLQTFSSTSQVGSGSLLMFPITVPQNIQFNQIILPQSISFLTGSVATASVGVTHVSKFGLYSMNGSSVFSLISSNSFSIGETIQSVSLNWIYPTTTATSAVPNGYGYGNLPAGSLSTTAQVVSLISGTRGVGLQFGGNIYLGEGRYWLGILGYKSATAGTNTFGLSNVGLIGQIMNPVNFGGNSTGPMGIGVAASLWTGTNNSNFTQWRGRHVAGFVTATSLTDFLGTAIPANVSLSAIGGTAANQTMTILPSVTFVST